MRVHPLPFPATGRWVDFLTRSVIVGSVVAAGWPAVRAAEPAPASPPKTAPAEADAVATERAARHDRFRTLVTGATLVGRFTIDRDDDAAEKPDAAPQPEVPLREEEYAISGAVPLGGDLWLITSRIRYGDKDLTVPVPVAVKWAGDTPLITLDGVTIPGLGTFSCRVVLDGTRYAGTWQHDAVGGHMFGRIRR